MGFRDDVVDGGSFCGYAVASAVLAKIFVALEDSGAADFPRSAITPFMPTFSSLIIAPAIASMLLPVSIAISAGIIGYCCAPTVAAWTFRTGRHDYQSAFKQVVSMIRELKLAMSAD